MSAGASPSSPAWNKWVRQIHRWVSLAFTAGFIVNTVIIVVLRQAQPAFWVYLLALVPLVGLFLTGLYLWVLPHAAGWRLGRRTGGF